MPATELMMMDLGPWAVILAGLWFLRLLGFAIEARPRKSDRRPTD